MAYKEAFGKAEARGLVPSPYLSQGLQASATREKMFRILMDERKWPTEGWSDQTIEILLNELSAMDSNNFLQMGGVGEREGRIYSNLVHRRHFGFAHGVGRSGDLGEAQPKAAGSTLLSSLTNALLLDLLKEIVCKKTVDAFLLPMATGMSIALCLQTMKRERPEATHVIWTRIDQKSCLKAIFTAGLLPIVVEPIREQDELQTNIEKISQIIENEGVEKILCLITTTSCFAPRATDEVEEVSKLVKDTPIFHLVNNAYGIQSTKCCHVIDQGARTGKIDVYVQSTDKNFMVPVGGAVVGGFSKPLLDKIRKNYPGRASSSQTVDVFITLLSMGSIKYVQLLRERQENYKYLLERMNEIAQKYGERVLKTPHNNISIGMTLTTLVTGPADFMQDTRAVTRFGSMLFVRNVQGSRVVVPNIVQCVDTLELKGWGSHCVNYPVPYLTAAASIGMQKKDIDYFAEKLNECFRDVKKEMSL